MFHLFHIIFCSPLSWLRWLQMNSSINSTDVSVNVTTASNRPFSALSRFEQQLFKVSYRLYNNKYGYLVSNATLLIVALSIITYGSYASLQAPKNAKDADKNKRKRSTRDHKDDKPSNAADEGFVTEKFALALPFICAIGLGSIYYGIKYIDPAKISSFLSHYTIFISVLSFHQFYSHTLKVIFIRLDKYFDLTSVIPRYRISIGEDKDIFEGTQWETNFEYVDLKGEQPLIKEITKDFRPPRTFKSQDQFLNGYISTMDIIAFFGAIASSTLYYQKQENLNWFFSNLVAWTFAFEGIVRLRLNSFVTGGIILTGLFFYDIYFVFGTDVMVSVATSIQIPVLMKLPSGANYQKHIIDYATDFSVPKLPLSMLGLGDIVIPGAVIAFCMRYDLYLYHQKESRRYHYLNSFPLIYFKAGVIGYTLGLVSTFVALHTFERAQPALLYLSPSIMGSILITGYSRGELSELWSYTEHEEDTSEEKEGEQLKSDKEGEQLKSDKEDEQTSDLEDDDSDFSFTGESESEYDTTDEELDLEEEIIHVQIQEDEYLLGE